jgi:hypothetical protein
VSGRSSLDLPTLRDVGQVIAALRKRGAPTILHAHTDAGEAEGVSCGVPRGDWIAAGFDVAAFDRDDSEATRRMAKDLLWWEPSPRETRARSHPLRGALLHPPAITLTPVGGRASERRHRGSDSG